MLMSMDSSILGDSAPEYFVVRNSPLTFLEITEIVIQKNQWNAQ